MFLMIKNLLLIVVIIFITISLIYILVWLFTKYFIVVSIRSNSMSLTIIRGDKTLILRRSYILKRDVIVLLNMDLVPNLPESTRHAMRGERIENWYIKRLIGLPEDPATDKTLWHKPIPDNHVFVKGDYEHSLDSRQWGPVPVSAIEGIVIAILSRKKRHESSEILDIFI